VLARFAEQQELNRCPDDLGSLAAGPSPNGAIKLLPTGMGRKLHRGGKSFAHLVRRHQQALSIRGARCMEFGLLGVGFIVRELIFNASS
jgi:hypothetical protein